MRPSARRCAETAAPLSAPVLAGAPVVRLARLRVGGFSARGVVARPSHPASVAALQQRLLVSTALLGRPGHFGRLAPSGTRARACGSDGRQDRRRELGRPWPLGVGPLRRRGRGSRARSPQRLPPVQPLGAHAGCRSPSSTERGGLGGAPRAGVMRVDPAPGEPRVSCWRACVNRP